MENVPPGPVKVKYEEVKTIDPSVHSKDKAQADVSAWRSAFTAAFADQVEQGVKK
ncbi:hypothetical protein D9M72_579970 [compost metagenome]